MLVWEKMKYYCTAAAMGIVMLMCCTVLADERPYFECAGELHSRALAKQAERPILPSEGVQHVLIIFAKFLDNEQIGEYAPSYASDLLNPDKEGSLSHFYLDMSEGRLRIEGKALEPIPTDCKHTKTIWVTGGRKYCLDCDNYIPGNFVAEALSANSKEGMK